MARQEESSRSTCTRRWDEPSTSMSRRTRRLRLRCAPECGVGKTRHIQVRWLWIQDAIRDKVVRLRKVKGTANEADMGTKDLDRPTHQRLLQKLPLKPSQCRRLLGLIATENGACVVEAQVDADEEEFWTFSPQVTIAILVAFVTCAMLERIVSGEVVQHSSSGEDC